MSELQNRRYKEVEPKETVKKLKQILNKIGIEVEENWSKESSVGTYSLRVCVKGTDIGQNGKGMTKDFARASGYAEFLERLQNGMFRFRIEKPTKELPFSYSPDEQILSIDELLEDNSLFQEILKSNQKQNKSKEEKIEFLQTILNEKSTLVEKEDYQSIPYYSVKHKKLVYIPYRLFSYLYNTNGMCAGNSAEEAIIEGISEILERYVGFQIFEKKVSLPEIPMEYISKFPKVKAMAEKLKENEQYYFKLVDCSFGGKYPVAGLYIIEKNTGRFGFKMGAHPDYGIAMERCFTEAAQGRDIYQYAKTCIFNFRESKEIGKNHTKFIFSDLAAIPYQIISEHPDYQFTEMSDVSMMDNQTILKKLVDSILAEGKDILIRDVSILGFPAFSIAIPSMSELSIDPTATYFDLFVTMQTLLKDISKINTKNIKEIIRVMETIVNQIGNERLSIYINVKDESILPCESIGMGGKYFLAICYIIDEQYGKAAEILGNLNQTAELIMPNPIEKIMVKAVYYYVQAMEQVKEHEKAMYYIRLLFSEEIADAIDKSFQNKDMIFINHYGLTPDDYVDNDDSYYLPFMKKIREIQKENVINQMKNKEIMEHDTKI